MPPYLEMMQDCCAFSWVALPDLQHGFEFLLIFSGCRELCRG